MNRFLRRALIVAGTAVIAAITVVGSVGLFQQQHEQDRINALTLELQQAVAQINDGRIRGCEDLNDYKTGLERVVISANAEQRAATTPRQRQLLDAFLALSKPKDCQALVKGH